MNGLEISRQYWEECGRPMIEERFPELMGLIAVGLVGAGSECYGYDDDVSRDHDFEPGFCIYLPDEERVSRRQEFLLGRAYESLPKEYMGLRRSLFNPAGGNRRGVFRTAGVFRAMTGLEGVPVGWRAYLSLPDQNWFEAIDGEVFYDGLGEFTAIREAWKKPPKDVVSKKLSGYLLRMTQTGEYNYERCLQRGDEAAARLAAAEFVKAAIGALGWAYGRPAPYYKWSFRFLQEFPEAGRYRELLAKILASDNATDEIHAACAEMMRILRERGIVVVQGTQAEGRTPAQAEGQQDDLQRAAVAINDAIGDGVLRNMSLLAAVN